MCLSACPTPNHARANSHTLPYTYNPYRKSHEPVKEKNWMPLVWRDELFMVHSVFPQRVFRWVQGAGVRVRLPATNARAKHPRAPSLPWCPLTHPIHTRHTPYPPPNRVNASGIAVQQFVSTAPSLFEPYKDEDIHGGPPMVLIPGHLSATRSPYYLGIFHFFKVGVVVI
jgi:hypothetical protein